MRPPQLRVARPSRDLRAATEFYTHALGLEVLAAFADHDGFDGVMLGHERWPFHLELTHRRRAPIAPHPTEEDLLVFYLPDRAEWSAAVQRVRDFGATAVESSIVLGRAWCDVPRPGRLSHRPQNAAWP